MEQLKQICARFFEVTRIPLALVNTEGLYIESWPALLRGIVDPKMARLTLMDFSLQGRDSLHPIINYVHPGFFVATAQVSAELFCVIGLTSPFRHSRKDLLQMCGHAIANDHLQAFCDQIMITPHTTLFQMRDHLCLLTQLITGVCIPDDAVLFVDNGSLTPDSTKKLSNTQFRQREDAESHVPTAFENGLADAVSLGRKDLLIRRLNEPTLGAVGKMSLDPLQQCRYSFISLATLLSRAAIRGGLPEETAFLLSDLYCQRMDQYTDTHAIERLTYDMSVDYCEKVAQNRLQAGMSPTIRKCLNYIAVHLHEPLGLVALSDHCGLGCRSLSKKFQEEVGLPVGEYIQREKTEEAKFLLLHTNSSLSEIAASLNYSSQSYFTHQFKKQTGQTPEKYREGRKIR